MKKCIVHFVIIAIVLQIIGKPLNIQAEELEVKSSSAILVESSTGNVIYEKNPDEKLEPASVTKVMTLLLIFEAIESGQFSLEDEVTVSEYAASMGGSQVYLDVGEIQTVDTMIKCIVISSGNDACVAMAEFVSGTESEFVNQMNLRAEELGMTNTHFVNCNGLHADGHVTTARDIGFMSRELVNKHPEIIEYSTVWMDTITHVTRKGSSEFGLSNTNKLLQTYEYTTGLKTGFTSDAGYCISATAQKEGIHLIAVIMGATTSDERSKDVVTLWNYGFAKTSRYEETTLQKFPDIPVKRGVADVTTGICKEKFIYIDTTGENLSSITKESRFNEDIEAPIEKNQTIGEVEYKLNDKVIGSMEIVSQCAVGRVTYRYYLLKLLDAYLL